MKRVVRFLSLFFVISVVASSAANAADAPEVQFSGFVDTYYSFNFNKPDSRTNGASANFDFEHNTFSLSLAELVVSSPAKPVGFRMDLDFGPTTDFVHGNTDIITHPPVHVGTTEGEVYKNIQQAYVTWATPVGLTLDMGKFVTHMGAEVIESKDNWNYTRGLLFCCAIPYYHSGVRANFPVNDMLYVNGYLYNGWNNVIENNNMKTFGAQIGLTPIKQVPILLSWIGPEKSEGAFEDRQVYEAIVGFNPTDQLSFMVDYNYGKQEAVATGDDQKYSGVALYARWKKEPCALALRYEMVDDEDNLMFGGVSANGNKVKELTVTAEHTIAKSLLTRIEFRMDKSDDDIYEDDDGGFTEDTQSRLVLGVVYTF